MADQYVIDTNWTLRVNSPVSVRERIGGWLRDLATTLDGRHSLAVKIVTTPAIARRTEVECIRYGMQQIEWAVKESVVAEGCEVLMNSNPQVDWNCSRGR